MSRTKLLLVVGLLMLSVGLVMFVYVYPAVKGTVQIIEGAPYNGPEKEWGYEAKPLEGPPRPWIETVPWLKYAICIAGVILLIGLVFLKWLGLI